MLSLPASRLLPVYIGQLNIIIVKNLVKSGKLWFRFLPTSTPLKNCTSNVPKSQVPHL